jgi:diacylglycerol kinase family enzyme
MQGNPDLVIVAGGDGTVRAVADVVHASDVPLAVIPTGTGNLLARNLGLPLGNAKQSIRTAFSGSDTPIDIAFIELEREDGARQRQAFLVMAGIGLDAQMAANTNPRLKKRIGWLAYTDPIARSVVGNKQFSMHYRLDGSRSRPLRAHTVIVGNCGTLTANILLLPDAVIDDGLLDVIVLRPRGGFGWALIASRLMLNRFTHRTKPGKLALRAAPEIGALQYVQGRTIVVRFSEPQQIQLDGDDFGVVAAVKISVRHQGLVLRMPGGASDNRLAHSSSNA